MLLTVRSSTPKERRQSLSVPSPTFKTSVARPKSYLRRLSSAGAGDIFRSLLRTCSPVPSKPPLSLAEVAISVPSSSPFVSSRLFVHAVELLNVSIGMVLGLLIGSVCFLGVSFLKFFVCVCGVFFYIVLIVHATIEDFSL